MFRNEIVILTARSAATALRIAQSRFPSVGAALERRVDTLPYRLHGPRRIRPRRRRQ
ncbi:hypothetical protein BVI2075_260072 [Burkholderia vietnamiensis]|nr:hypothetical protein BVI2075_260072 [Burkholderia vietnamiensis]CAG9199022.1 hypothetical protein BVI1335_1390027 [Burkholderia vietnamiensis]